MFAVTPATGTNASSKETVGAVPLSRATWWMLGAMYFLATVVLLVGTAGLLGLGDEATFLEGLRGAGTLWGPYLIAAPGIFRLARRWPLDPGVWRRNLAWHLLISVAFVGICEWAEEQMRPGPPGWSRPDRPGSFRPPPDWGPPAGPRGEPPPGGPRPRGAEWEPQTPPRFGPPPGHGHRPPPLGRLDFLRRLQRVQVSLPTYWVIVGFAQVLGYAWRLQERDRRAAALEMGMTQARLEALQTQLQPHFLFNALNAIAALIPVDPRAADAMLANLSDLLRAALDRRHESETGLSDELQLLRRYVAIQQVRFQDRLKVDYEIASGCLEARVPTLMLQPLVENAIEHGTMQNRTAGQILIRAVHDSERLMIEVSDNGPGIPPETLARLREGVGLSNTRTRLVALYGVQQRLDLRTNDAGGLTVVIEIPLRATAASTPPELP